jgi:hypothetical protein
VGNGNGDAEESAEDKGREHVMKDRVRMKYSCGYAGVETQVKVRTWGLRIQVGGLRDSPRRA